MRVQLAEFAGEQFLLDLAVPLRISRDEPIFDRSLVVISYQNLDRRMQNVVYNVPQFFFTGYTFISRTSGRERVFRRPRPVRSEPTDIMHTTFDALERDVLASREIMEYYEEYEGPAIFGDGRLRIQFDGEIMVDERPYEVRLGPLEVEIEMGRDWAADLRLYLEV